MYYQTQRITALWAGNRNNRSGRAVPSASLPVPSFLISALERGATFQLLTISPQIHLDFIGLQAPRSYGALTNADTFGRLLRLTGLAAPLRVTGLFI